MPRPYRHTKIIATLGPATESRQRLSELIGAGVDIMRLNMAHASKQWVDEVLWHIREVSSELGRHVAVMMDVKGPEIRTGPVDQPVELQAGDPLVLFTEHGAPAADGTLSVSVNYPGLPADLDLGSKVLVDSGLLHLQVVAKDDTRVRCEVLTPGTLGSRRHINLPGVRVRLPALTEKDEQDIRTGVAAGIDFAALSFVRQAEDVVTLRKLLDELGSPARIIAKIEDQAGVENMREIIREADGVMIARGDLGIEIEYHQLPLVQTRLIEACHAEGKPVIVATHLLESMVSSPMPTRAEVADITNGIREQADAMMLSGETTVGAYPIESVEVMKNVISSIEPSLDDSLNARIRLKEPKTKMLRSAAVLAQELGDSGIVVFTRTGLLPYVLAALRPRGVPIYAFTDVEPVFRQLLLPWGVEPFLLEFSEEPEKTIQDALAYLKRRGWCGEGDWLVVITNALAAEIIDTIQLRQVD
jgi:pyruvate kinase